MNYMTTQTYRAYAVRTLRLLAFVVGALGVTSVSVRANELIDLGANVSPTDINDLGTVVGWRSTATGNVGFVRPSGGTVQDIQGTTSANAINGLEQITGNTPTGAFLKEGVTMSTWDGYGGYGINEIGQISGNKELKNRYQPSPLPLDPAIYTPNRWRNLGIAKVYPRGTLQGVYADMFVLFGINSSGYSVGKHMRYGLAGSSAILTEPAFHSVIYLPIPNGGHAAAINDNLLVVGATGNSRAYLYDYTTPAVAPVDLGALDGAAGTSSAADINNSNAVVGTSSSGSGVDHAVLWENRGATMADLNNDAAVVGSGWVLIAATAINESGDIVGTGLRNGEAHGFLLSTTGEAAPAAAPVQTQTTVSKGKGKGKP